jgi:hypothetical protein
MKGTSLGDRLCSTYGMGTEAARSPNAWQASPDWLGQEPCPQRTLASIACRACFRRDSRSAQALLHMLCRCTARTCHACAQLEEYVRRIKPNDLSPFSNWHGHKVVGTAAPGARRRRPAATRTRAARRAACPRAAAPHPANWPCAQGPPSWRPRRPRLRARRACCQAPLATWQGPRACSQACRPVCRLLRRRGSGRPSRGAGTPGMHAERTPMSLSCKRSSHLMFAALARTGVTQVNHIRDPRPYNMGPCKRQIWNSMGAVPATENAGRGGGHRGHLRRWPPWRAARS